LTLLTADEALIATDNLAIHVLKTVYETMATIVETMNYRGRRLGEFKVVNNFTAKE